MAKQLSRKRRVRNRLHKLGKMVTAIHRREAVKHEKSDYRQEQRTEA